MTLHYFDLAFTPGVRKTQDEHGSGSSYGRLIPDSQERDELTEMEMAFISDRDSFYMATVSETGWPYVQHRGGPRGFVKILSNSHIGIASYSGNRQYISLGNIQHNDRTSLFFMDYANRRRLKIMARTRAIDAEKEPELANALRSPDYKARIEGGLIFQIEAYDWNCPQHITPRFTETEAKILFGSGSE